MSDPFEGKTMPRAVLFGAGAMIVVVIGLVLVAQFTGVGRVETPEAEPVHAMDVRFEDRADGAVEVYDAENDRRVEVLAPGSNGFVRGVLRGLARDRMLEEIGKERPFRLTRWSDGRLSLEDPTTGRTVDLNAFGKTNTAAFAELLAAGRGTAP